ncbi:MAG: serine hydrolase [Cytophagales bacterium]|nr:serine hydrolase [Cytophaga sp.]
MKKRIAVFVSLFLVLLIMGIHLTGQNYIYKSIWYNFPGIYDQIIFEKHIIHKSSVPLKWPLSSEYNKKNLSDSLVHTLESLHSIAFLMIQNDSVKSERYWEGASDTSHSNSFSVSKSFINALVGRALKMGYIKSLDQKVAAFIPEFETGDRKNISIRHLLMMSSGLNWDEAYSSLWSQTTKAYYGTDLQSQMLALSSIKKPGEYVEYKSCDTELLAMVLTKATGMKLSDFFQKELWQPLGAESVAYWSLDHKDGLEKAYCCLYSNARDMARLGLLYLHKGNWKGVQLIDTSFIQSSITASQLKDPETNLHTDFYGYQWWTIPNYKGLQIYYMRGILGQYVIVIPALKTVIVRLGHERGNKIYKHFPEVYLMIDEALGLH